MGGWRRYLELQAQAKTGLGSGLFIWALLAATFAILTAAFILLVAFIWLAERYDPLRAAAALLPSSSKNMSLDFRVKQFLRGVDAPKSLRQLTRVPGYAAATMFRQARETQRSLQTWHVRASASQRPGHGDSLSLWTATRYAYSTASVRQAPRLSSMTSVA